MTNRISKIHWFEIEGLKPSEYNPRKMNRKQADDLKESIENFGIVDPIIVNENPDRLGVIIGGHQRYNIAKELNYQEVPCVFVNLSLEKERELNIRLNKNTGEWDWDMLANFDGIELVQWGFTAEEIGKFLLDEDIQDLEPEEDPTACPKCKRPYGNDSE